MLAAIFLTGILAVLNGAKYQSLSNYLHLTYGYPTHEIAFLFSLSNLCGLTFGFLMLSFPSIRNKFSGLHIAVLLFQAIAYGLSLFFRDVYSIMLLQRMLEGFVFAFIMNFYPVALTRNSPHDKTELIMCMWGLVYALGFAFSNSLASLPIPHALAYNLPSLMLIACLIMFNRRVMLSVKSGHLGASPIMKPSLSVLTKIGMVAIPFFLFTFIYNSFLFTYSSNHPTGSPLSWMMLVNGAGILFTNALISSGKVNATFFLLFIVAALWFQLSVFSNSSLPASTSIVFILGMMEGVIFGFFVRHFMRADFDLVKAGYLVSGSLGATLGPLFPLYLGKLTPSLSVLFLAACISLLTLNEISRRDSRLRPGGDHV
ncbi:hypothetical protein K6R05_18505 (plasmid) [Pantoea alfalfae]|uniref:hypothetical protein n=1 Tax=Pantoea alfalfae TaxID=3074822 RepID=UPI001CA3CDD6|nr:hypothetical protein [Pantoea alfalfae]QZX97634.1 hypothetical protein K6R05_18505 [Pantoea alfalfae]